METLTFLINNILINHFHSIYIYIHNSYSDKAQPCYCGEPTCTGFIGGNKKSELKEIISEGIGKNNN